ncbi:unnamed protein product [Bursaphelenchus okinawaensis]|uniref:Tyrosine-protein phosphatase domain-containing protein n=1 Tax=Bursaphelenchus okinawaensis TaxID=465554 RepID=A0A811KF01_9BILA|nr:unnamed protein product [Bursaphelenchus okinawaensis]CAG9102038.1 unnamed protein product [Bursaphelenchus okinawaensis]
MGDKDQRTAIPTTVVKGKRKLNEAGVKALTVFASRYSKIGMAGIKAEFEEAKKECKPIQKSFTFVEATIHSELNRNVETCPDVNRVVLTCNVPPNTDFYNANYITMPEFDRPFIAAQTPMPHTISDFWRMVFQENCSTVLMAGSPKENDAVEFWPKKLADHCNYNDIFVNTRRVDENSDYIIYKLEVLPEGCSNSVLVSLIVCLDWPENSRRAGHFLGFLKAWKQFPSLMEVNAKDPVVVISRLGQGRTGAVLLYHAAALAVTQGKEINLKSLLKSLRKQRPGLVGTADQYAWVVMNVLLYYSVKVSGILAYTTSLKHEYDKIKLE